MRLFTIAIVLATVPLAGCSERSDSIEGESQTSTSDTVTDDAQATVMEPEHPVGRAWTFKGQELYNPDSEFTVVVARADQEGYLFAGGSTDDVVYDALWQSPWLGERSRDMDRFDWENNVLEFPLYDGKSWTYYGEQVVTATAARVKTPSGETEGFRIEGERINYDYSTALGQIVRWERIYSNGQVGESLTLVAIADGVQPVWYEPGPLVSVFSAQEASVFEVGAGYDAVVASAGGTNGAGTQLTTPSGEVWRAEFAGEEMWLHSEMSAEQGRWSASVIGWPYADGTPPPPTDPPIGWGVIRARPVKWL